MSREARSEGVLYPLGKRAFDLVVTSLGILFLAPLFVMLSILILLEDHGPVLYAQTRVGKGGREFKFWKFRSM